MGKIGAKMCQNSENMRQKYNLRRDQSKADFC